MGVNSRDQMAEIHQNIQQATQKKLMLAGATIVDPSQTYIDPRVEIGRDTVIYPFTSISGAVTIGENCQIGPSAVISGPVKIDGGTTIGPFQTVG